MSTNRGRPRSAERDLAIRTAALELLAARGARGLTVEAVAARAGVAKTTIYRRWSGRAELLTAAVRGLARPVARPVGDDVATDLITLVDGAAEVLRGDGAGLIAVVVAEALRDAELATVVRQELLGPRRKALVGVVRRAVADGSLKPGTQPDLVADLLLAPVYYRAVVVGEDVGADVVADLVHTVLGDARPG